VRVFVINAFVGDINSSQGLFAAHELNWTEIELARSVLDTCFPTAVFTAHELTEHLPSQIRCTNQVVALTHVTNERASRNGIRYDTRCYFDVRSERNQLKRGENKKKLKSEKRTCSEVSVNSPGIRVISLFQDSPVQFMCCEQALNWRRSLEPARASFNSGVQ